MAQLANMIEGGGINRGDVSFEGEVIVQDDSKSPRLQQDETVEREAPCKVRVDEVSLERC